jgi:membrane protein
VRRRLLLIAGALAAITLLPDRRRPPAGAPARRPVSAPIPPEERPPSEPLERPRAWRRAARVLRASARAALGAGITDAGAALAYYAFLAIPAMLLVAVGAFGLFAQEGAIDDITDRLDGVVPDEALTLIDDTLTRVTESSGSGLALALVGIVLALWTASGAMSALMRGLNRVHDRKETRSFARQRLTALALLGWTLLAVVVSFTLLVLGAPISRAVGESLNAETAVGRLWWAAQWPILIGALLLAVAGILRIGPAGGGQRRSRAVLTGACVAVAIWLVASAGFAVYVSRFSSYGAAWGSLSAVIVMLTWLWLTSLAILFGGQVQAVMERRAGTVSPRPVEGTSRA